MQPSGNQRPDLLTALVNMSLALRLPRKMHLCRSSSNVPRLPSFLEMLQAFTFFSLLTRCTIPCACRAKRHLNVKKAVRACGAFNIFTSKCASRHNGVHFFDIATSTSAPKLRCLVHFYFEMCFAPQRRALFRHRNFKKCSEYFSTLRSHKSLGKHRVSRLSYLFANLDLLSSETLSLF